MLLLRFPMQEEMAAINRVIILIAVWFAMPDNSPFAW